MKRFMLVVVLFVCTTFAYSQQSICGVDFGSSYESAKNILEGKFGKAEVDKGYEIWYFNREYAGFGFYAIWFRFQSDGYNTYLNGCSFINKFKDAASAKQFKARLLARLSMKYDNIESYTDKHGWLRCQGGKSPVTDSDFAFEVFTSKSDDREYSIWLDYGNYDYVDEEF